MLLALDTVDEIVTSLRETMSQQSYHGLVFFGGNGGLERFALDCRSGAPPFPVVTIDPVAGPDSAEQIASDAASFVAAIGLEYRIGPRDA
jgi:hypothetical protein